MTTLYIRESAGFREAAPDEILRHAQVLMSRRFRSGSPVLTSPTKVRQYLKLHLGTLEYELFGVLHLDTRRRLIAVEDLFRGTIDSAAVHPREVVKSALRYGSSGLVLFHNHASSGVPEPSPADEHITRRLKDALSLVEIVVVDHLIVGETVYSMAEHGLI
jgi:DNA repair protein RadC